jgi:1-acyl-sn-glycerol-3-phosphate acyltransferase
MIGGIFYSIFFPIWTLFVCTIGLPLAFTSSFLKKDFSYFGRFWARTCLFWLKAFTGIKVVYLGEIPKEGGKIVASEHQSVLEIIALMAVLEKPIFILKQSLLYLPIFNIYLKTLGMIGVNRQRLNKGWLETAKQRLNDKKTLIIFPEGTRVEFGSNSPYRNGVFKISKEADIKLVPVCVNTGLFWARRKWKKNAGVAKIIFGNEDFYSAETLRKEMQRLNKEYL